MTSFEIYVYKETEEISYLYFKENSKQTEKN